MDNFLFFEFFLFFGGLVNITCALLLFGDTLTGTEVLPSACLIVSVTARKCRIKAAVVPSSAYMLKIVRPFFSIL